MYITCVQQQFWRVAEVLGLGLEDEHKLLIAGSRRIRRRRCPGELPAISGQMPTVRPIGLYTGREESYVARDWFVWILSNSYIILTPIVGFVYISYYFRSWFVMYSSRNCTFFIGMTIFTNPRLTQECTRMLRNQIRTSSDAKRTDNEFVEI